MRKAAATGRSQVVAIGMAQEYQRVFTATKSEAGTSAVWFSYHRTERRVSCYYFYLWDAEVGPAFVKKMLRRHRAGESLEPKHEGGAQAKLNATARERLRAAVAKPALKWPQSNARTESPGASTFTSEASQAPVPDVG